jgi:ABC-type multidrug transport system ATPase subunit
MRIEIDHLTKEYEGGIVALQDVTFQIGPGVFGLLGPNGSGKTTLMSVLATLLAPTQGTIRVNEWDIRRDKAEIRRILGYLPQDVGLYPSMTVFEFLDYMALLYNMNDPKRRAAAIEEAMQHTNTLALRDRPVGTLSGGQQQRVGIAQAVLNSPSLLIVDEPTTGLDPEERIRLRSLLAELGEDRVVLLSTHIAADIEAVADNLAILKRGRLQFFGTPEQLLDRIAGRIWSLETSRRGLAELRQRYQETGVYRTASGIQVRIVADEVDLPEARRVEPTLEDAYVWIMGAAPDA